MTAHPNACAPLWTVARPGFLTPYLMVPDPVRDYLDDEPVAPRMTVPRSVFGSQANEHGVADQRTHAAQPASTSRSKWASTMTQILLIEDDAETADAIVSELTERGFEVQWAPDGIGGLDYARESSPDAMIVDRMLPGMDGLTVIEALRKDQVRTPVLVLSALGAVDDRVRGLRVGGDDYLTKPFGPRELLARVRAILRRANGAPAKPLVRRFAFDRFVIDLDARSVETAGAEAPELQLTSAEFDLLGCFVQRPRRVLTRDQILDWTRGRSAEPFDRTVDMLISRLRRKLDGASPGSNLITTVRNGGYLFTASVKQVS